MDGRTKYLLKNTSILTISNFSSKLLSFLLVPLYTAALTAEEYGSYELIMSTLQLLIPFLTLNIVDGVLCFLLDKNISKKMIKSIGLKYIVLSIFGMALLLGLNHIFNIWLPLKEFEIYTFLYFVFYIFNQLFIQTAKGQEQVKALGISGIISTFTSLIANILLLVLFPLGLKGFFTAYIIGQAISAFYLCYVTSFFSDLTIHIDKELQQAMLKYSFPLIWGTLGWLINNVSDRYVVTWLCGLAENGIYSVSYKIPTIITTVQNIFIQAWVISAIKEYESPTRNIFYKETFIKLNFLMVSCCTVLITGTKFVAKILFAKDFFDAWQYAPFLLVSVVFGASSGFIGPILSAKKDSKTQAKSTLYGAIANLVLNIILVYFIGAQGAAIATALSNIIIYLVRRKAIGNMLYGKYYKKVIFSWLLLMLQATMMILDLSIILQFPITILLLFLYKKVLLQIWKVFITKVVGKIAK